MTRASTRELILAEAKRLFAERGPDAVSISDIARAAGVSKANVFHHFESREGLYLAVISRVIDDMPRALPDAARDDEVVSGFQDMAAAELTHASGVAAGALLILREVLSGDPRRKRVLAEEIFADDFLRLVGRIRDEQAGGRFRNDFDPALVATILRSATAFFVLGREVLHHLPGVRFADDPEYYAREAMRLLLQGLLREESDTSREQEP